MHDCTVQLRSSRDLLKFIILRNTATDVFLICVAELETYWPLRFNWQKRVEQHKWGKHRWLFWIKVFFVKVWISSPLGSTAVVQDTFSATSYQYSALIKRAQTEKRQRGGNYFIRLAAGRKYVSCLQLWKQNKQELRLVSGNNSIVT
jgi:hypothetical protein